MVLAGMASWSAPTGAQEDASRQQPQILVSNLGVGVSGTAGIQRPLFAVRSGFAQAFTTGTHTGGYTLGSVGLQVTALADAPTAGTNSG